MICDLFPFIYSGGKKLDRGGRSWFSQMKGQGKCRQHGLKRGLHQRRAGPDSQLQTGNTEHWQDGCHRVTHE